MSYEEYEDLRKICNNQKTTYTLYTLDGVGTERQGQDGVKFVEKSFALLFEMQKEFLKLEKLIGTKILVRNHFVEALDRKTIKNGYDSKMPCSYNPNFVCGDLISFYIYNHSLINDDLFEQIFNHCAKKLNNNFTYHFAKQKYQTNDYTKAGSRYWVGHAQQFLNSKEGKKERIKDFCIKSLIDNNEISQEL